ncbi:hypothetical protein KUCAC02_016174 [Chaenocephalus aceratus]|uniref:Uncharacterized protein n=1 Tax=Chaenocephalus aceratus TaxID=36190 RepID=A0ACB9Y1C0_CHAAC|nr:hypothetical protein KUCAC02_016174 [Chaenocephalus aceratus]
MESFYTEIKHYVLNGGYHDLTIAAKKPDTRKAFIRRASKQYLIKAGDVYYTYKDNERMVVCTKDQINDVLKECHDNLGSGGHAGRRRTAEKVSATYHWSTMREDVKKWVDECPRCQQHEAIKTVAPVLHPIHVPEAWTVLGVDLIGPLPTTAKGKGYILTATDLFTKWVKIITDQGREFVNEVNRGVFDALGVKHCITSAYHPQCNGQDERALWRALTPQSRGQPSARPILPSLGGTLASRV